MSNHLNVRRVMFQDIDVDGSPIGEPKYGIVASDSYASAFVDGYDTNEELQEAIDNSKSLIELVDSTGYLFADIDHEAVGKIRYYDKYPSTNFEKKKTT